MKRIWPTLLALSLSATLALAASGHGASLRSLTSAKQGGPPLICTDYIRIGGVHCTPCETFYLRDYPNKRKSITEFCRSLPPDSCFNYLYTKLRVTCDSGTPTPTPTLKPAPTPAPSRPQPCSGDEFKIASLAAEQGEVPSPLASLAGTSLSPAQVLSAPGVGIEYTFGDGRMLRLEAESKLRLNDCEGPSLKGALQLLLGKVWATVKAALAGREPEIDTVGAANSVRGTQYSLAYDPKAKRTTLTVVKGVVAITNRSGNLRKTILVKAGQTAVQVGDGVPRLTGSQPGGSGWTATAAARRGKNGQRFSFTCPPGGSPAHVWGTDTYTDDSSVCTAAVQAGLVTLASGGTVTIEIRPGASSYTGSSRHGITSESYGSWKGSYAFVTGG